MLSTENLKSILKKHQERIDEDLGFWDEEEKPKDRLLTIYQHTLTLLHYDDASVEKSNDLMKNIVFDIVEPLFDNLKSMGSQDEIIAAHEEIMKDFKPAEFIEKEVQGRYVEYLMLALAQLSVETIMTTENRLGRAYFQKFLILMLIQKISGINATTIIYGYLALEDE